MKKNLISLLALFAIKAHAGGELIGNGGDAVVCYDQKQAITGVELLDFYEATNIQGLTLDLGSITDSVEQKVALMISRLETNLITKNEFLLKLKNFTNEAAIVPNVNLIDIDDSHHIIVPVGCQVQQVAIQKEPKFTYEKRYLINKTFWDLMNNDQKAGLVFHELIYGLNLGTGDSRAVRALNSLVAANFFSKISVAQALDLFRANNIISFMRDGFDYNTIETLLYDKNTFKVVVLNASKEIKFQGGTVKTKSFENNIKGEIETIKEAQVIKTVELTDITDQKYKCGTGNFVFIKNKVFTCNQLGGDIFVSEKGFFEGRCRGAGNIISFNTEKNEIVCKTIKNNKTIIKTKNLGFTTIDKIEINISQEKYCLNTFGKKMKLVTLSENAPGEVPFTDLVSTEDCNQFQVKSRNYLMYLIFGVDTSFEWELKEPFTVKLTSSQNKQIYKIIKGIIKEETQMYKINGQPIIIAPGTKVVLDENENYIGTY